MESKYKLTMCRLCLCENQSFFNIFNLNDWHGLIAAEIISNLLRFKVSETDGYPHVVCSKCLVKLTDFKLFKECCQNSKVKYDDMFVSSEILEEIKTEIDVGDGGSGLELCERDPLGEASSDITMKSEEVIIDSSSYEVSEDPVIESEVSCGPILLKYEVLPFSRDSHRQEELIDSEVSGNKEKVESTATLMQESPQDNMESLMLEPEEGDMDSTEDNSVRKEVEYMMEKMKNDIGVDREALTGTGQEKGARKRREGLECFHCGIVLMSKLGLIRHMKVHGFVNSYDCPECGKAFRFNSQLKIHLLTHTGSKPHKCAECSKSYSRSFNLQTHMRIHTGTKPYSCAECSKHFRQIGDLKKHMRLHTGIKPYKCAECSKSFSQSSTLKTHMRIHTGSKPYKCAECSKSFSQICNLKTHMRLHTGTKPYECAECSKSFSVNSTLITHMRLHTGSKPYKCAECSKSFTQSSTLKTHIRTHTGTKPYECAECSKRFSDGSYLKKHMRIHTGFKPYKCAECSKSFSVNSTLKKHMRLHKGSKPYKCAECSKCFNQNSALKTHIKITHSFKTF